MISVSVDILMPTYIYQLGSDNYTLGVYYTLTVEYFGQEHLPYAIALSFLFVFLYPFQFFQTFFHTTGTFFKPLLTPIKVVTRMNGTGNIRLSMVYYANIVDSTNSIHCPWLKRRTFWLSIRMKKMKRGESG